MAEPQEELFEIADRLELLANDAKEPRAEDPLAALEDAANTIGKGWRGSWLVATLVFTTKISSRRLPGHIFQPSAGIHSQRRARRLRKRLLRDLESVRRNLEGRADLLPSRRLRGKQIAPQSSIRLTIQ